MRPFVLVILAVAWGACGPPPLESTLSTPESLAQEVLNAFALRDEVRLRALAIDAEEFELHVWPSLPAAQPGRNLPWSYVWGDLRQKSDANLQRLLGTYGGRRLLLESIRFAGGTTHYAAYTVHRQAVLRVRENAEALDEVRVFGSAIEQAGRWKVFSYVVDD
jgi:hypothetical protein